MKILVLGALVVLLNLPVSEAHSILRIKEGGKEDTSIISDALGAVEDAFANLKKHQDEMSEHIKDLVVLQDQVDIPEITKGRESKRFQFYTDYWRGLKRNWKHRKFHVGENGKMNLHDGLKIIVNIDLSQDTTMSPSQNTRNFPFRNNDDSARTTTSRTLAFIPQKGGISDAAKFLNVGSDIEISPEEDTNTSLPESLRLPITRDFETSELEDPKTVFNELNSELGIPSTERSIKEEKRESISQITQSDLLEEANGQAMNGATNKINFLQHLAQPSTSSSALQASITLPFYITTEHFVENSVPPIDYSLPPPELEQSSLISWPDITSVPSVSTELPPVTTKVVPATVSPAVPHESEHIGPPSADTFGRSNVFANVLQAGATILPDTRDSEFPFPIPDGFNPKRTIEKTIKVGAEILARDTPLFRSFPNPLEPTRALKKGVEAGVEIISEATKDQNMFLNGSPNALRQLSKLGNVMLADTIMPGPLKSEQVPTGIPEDEGKFDSQESNSELSHETLLLPVSLLDIPESVETVTELKGVVPQSTENMFDIDERFTDISVTTSCPQILPENNQSSSNEALSKIEIDEACPVRNEIDYGITDINIPVDKSYKSEDKDEEKDGNNYSHNNTKYEISSAGRKGSDQPLEQILYTDKKMIPTHFLDSEISLNLSQADSVIRNTLVGPPLIRNPKEARSKLESPQKQLIPPIGVPLISLNLLNIVIVPPESKKVKEMDPSVLSSKSSLTLPPPFEIPPKSLNFKASKPLIPSSGIPPSPIDISQLLLNPFNANVSITDPVKTLNSGDETLSSTIPVTELNEASSPVRMHQLEEGVSKTESAKADKIDTKALLPTVPVIASSGIPSTTDINQLSPNPLKTVGMPPALNPLKGAAKVAELPIAVEAEAKQLSPAESVIPPLTETPQLSQNLFEAERLVTQPADILKSGDKTLPSVAPVILPNEAPSPVSTNPHETMPREVIPARPKALRPTVSQNEMLPPTETLQQSLHLLESSIATAHLTKALEPASEASSSTASNTSRNETALPVEMPYVSLHPHDSGPAITESANTAEQLSTKSPSNILQPVDAPQLSLNTFSTDGAIVDPTKNLGSADRTLLSALSSIQPKGTALPADEASPPIASNTSPNETALPVEMPYVSMHPYDSGPTITESANTDEQLSTTALSRILQPVDVPQLSLSTFSADGAIVDPTKSLGSADGTLLSVNLSIQPKGTASPADEASPPIASNTSPNEAASSIEVSHESLHPQDGVPAIVESPDNAEQLSTTAPSRLEPVDVPQSSLNTFSAGGAIADPTKNLGSADGTLSSAGPSIQSKGTALPVDITFRLLNPLEEDVAMDDPTKTLDPFSKALSFTVPVIPSNGTASSDGIPPLIHDPFGAGVGTAESNIGILTGAKAVTPTMPLNDIPPPIYVPQLPLNSFDPGIAMAAPAMPFESASQVLSSSDILPNGTVSPIEIPPVSPSAEAIGSGDEKISSTASDILPNGKVSLIEARSTPLHPHESGLETSESAKSSEGGTAELSPSVSSTLPGITPPTEVPHLSLDKFGTDVVATDLLKDVASHDRTLSPAVPFIQSKETAISGDLPSLLLNPLEVGATMANPTKALESFGEAVSFTVPVIPSNETASSGEVPPLIHDPFGAGVGKDESAKGIQTGAKAPSATGSSNNIPLLFEVPHLPLNSFDPGINMANPTVPFESASEAISSSVSDTLLTETVSPVEISPVSPTSNAIGSGAETVSDKASVISQNGTVSPADIPAMSLPHESGLGIADPAKASEKDTEELSHKPSSTSPGGIPPPDEVPHLPLSTFGADVTVADPTSYLGSDDKTRPSTVPIIQPEETALPVRIQSDQANTPESVGKAPSFSAPIKTPNGTVPPPLMLNLFGGAIFRTESSNSVQIGAKASSIDIPKQSSNSFMDDLATALEPSINAPTVSIRPSKKISSQVELPPTSLNPIDAGLEITESSKIAGKCTENLSTTGPVTSPSEISEQSAKPTETNAAQLLGTGEIVSTIGVPQLSQNPLEADVDPEKFPESDDEASTASENPSTTGTPQFSVNLFEVGLATVNPPKALEPGHKALSSPVPIQLPTGIPNMSPAVATNVTGVEPSKISLDDGKVPSYHLEINSNADLLKQEVLSIPHSATQRASAVFPFSHFNLDSEVTRSSSVPSSEASVPENQDSVSELSTQIPLTIDLPIIPPNLSESVSSSTVAAVPEELSSKSPSISSSMPSTPWLTTPMPLRIPSLPAEATTLKQSSVGTNLSQVSGVAQASVTQQQNNVKAASELSTQIPLTTDLPIISSSPSESVASSTFAVVPEVHANITKELSSKSPVPLKVSSLPVEAATLKQSSVGIKLSEVPEIAEAGPKLTRSTFSKEPHISEELDDEIIEMESGDLASDWNRDMLGKAPIPSAASSIVEMDFGRKDPTSLYKIFNVMRDLSGKKLKYSGTSTNI